MSEGSPLLTIVGLGALTLIPFVFMATTSFVKLSIVFSVLRNALGTGDVPSGMVVTALATILTFYVMAPTFAQVVDAASESAAKIDLDNPLAGSSAKAVYISYERGKEPLRKFLLRNAGEKERKLFVNLATQTPSGGQRLSDGDLMVVLPAFLITELKEAFQIAFLVFIPFLVIDLVVANIILALGMHMLAPTAVSLPFKLLLFVLVDGWYVLARALIAGYQ